MDLTADLSFDSADRRDVYDFVEGRGRVRAAVVRRALNLGPRAFGHHVTVLSRDGYLRKEGAHLRIAHGDEERVEHEAGDVTCVIRAADESDLPGLVDVVRGVAAEGTYIEAETVARVLDHEGVVHRHNDARSRLVFVADVDDAVVGWVHLDLPETEKLSHTAVLTLGLLPEYRGRGIGTALLDRGVCRARDHGVEKLYNSVPATNEAAVSFLEDRGWTVEATREGHYRIDGADVDEVMLATYP